MPKPGLYQWGLLKSLTIGQSPRYLAHSWYLFSPSFHFSLPLFSAVPIVVANTHITRANGGGGRKISEGVAPNSNQPFKLYREAKT